MWCMLNESGTCVNYDTGELRVLFEVPDIIVVGSESELLPHTRTEMECLKHIVKTEHIQLGGMICDAAWCTDYTVYKHHTRYSLCAYLLSLKKLDNPLILHARRNIGIALTFDDKIDVFLAKARTVGLYNKKGVKAS